VTKSSDADAAAARVDSELGGLDILVCSAGVGGDSVRAVDMPDEEWRRVFAINCDGTFFCNRAAVRKMVERGYGQDDVNLVMSDETRKKHFAADGRETELGSKALEGAGTGAAIGGAVGATLAAIAAIGTTLALPGLGLLIAGPIAAGLAGAGAGGATGGLIGALIGAGIPEERVKKYEEGVKQGGIMMGVTPRNPEDAAYFEEDWKKNRGEQVYR